MASKERNYNSVDDIIKLQTTKKNDLLQVVSIIQDQKHFRKHVVQAFDIIYNIKNNLKTLQKERERCKEFLQKVDHCESEAQKIESKISYIEQNLPHKFKKLAHHMNFTENTLISENGDNTPLLSSRRHLNFADSFSQSAQKKPISTRQFEIPYTTQKEFDSIPGYMRGRVACEALNSFIDKVNFCIKEKYNFINRANTDKQKGTALKRGVNDKLVLYKRQNTRALKDKRFITQDDLKTVMNGKIDKNTFGMITMLRHIQRLQENRDEGLLRYVVV